MPALLSTGLCLLLTFGSPGAAQLPTSPPTCLGVSTGRGVMVGSSSRSASEHWSSEDSRVVQSGSHNRGQTGWREGICPGPSRPF